MHVNNVTADTKNFREKICVSTNTQNVRFQLHLLSTRNLEFIENTGHTDLKQQLPCASCILH